MLTRSSERIFNPMRYTGLMDQLERLRNDVSLFEGILKNKYIKTKFTFKYIRIFFIFLDFGSVTMIPI